MIYHLIIAIQFIVVSSSAPGKEYTASMFGARSDGKTINTGSIQKAIDFIHENGGGTLVFYTGRYLTGGIRLKSNVHMKLEDGAVLVGSSSPFDYNSSAGERALISAEGQENIAITGHGYIDGNAEALLKNMNELDKKDLLVDSVALKPALIGFIDCKEINLQEINLWQSAGAVQKFGGCSNISISKIVIKNSGAGFPSMIFYECAKVTLKESYIESSGKPLEWKGDRKGITIEKTVNQNGSTITL
ncbi:glycosyl hydrolase family 28 protein [Pollutibacter soli]|uniref:glycosyl hydrolase family 28 protein n=1 Tax=Pollutibacter soli TaxID=3034157 RepID=UPI003013EEEE